MAVKKNKLVIAPFDDIQIIGINAPMADYKLAYHFNEAFHFSFIRLKEVLLDDVLPYAFFYYNAGENRNTYDLVSLKYKDHRCVKLNPQLDYLLIVRNPITGASKGSSTPSPWTSAAPPPSTCCWSASRCTSGTASKNSTPKPNHRCFNLPKKYSPSTGCGPTSWDSPCSCWDCCCFSSPTDSRTWKSLSQGIRSTSP